MCCIYSSSDGGGGDGSGGCSHLSFLFYSIAVCSYIKAWLVTAMVIWPIKTFAPYTSLLAYPNLGSSEKNWLVK